MYVYIWYLKFYKPVAIEKILPFIKVCNNRDHSDQLY